MQTSIPVRSDPPEPVALSDQEAAALVAKTQWYHGFRLRDGLTTPGGSVMDAAGALDALNVPRDLRNKRGLDIGAWDGPLTFELERRGATAIALDIQDPTRVGFDTARRILQSRAVHYKGSVYQLPFDDVRDLDVVLFRGVFYHLKYPLLAFECISSAMKVGGTLYFEGEGFINYAETLNGDPVDPSLLKIATSKIPVCLSYPNKYKNASNWFIPNAACLEGWLEASGFQVERMNSYTEYGAQRLYGHARKVGSVSTLLEHPLY